MSQLTLADFVEAFSDMEGSKVEICVQNWERKLRDFLPRAEAWAGRFLDAAVDYVQNIDAAPQIAGHTESLTDVVKHPLAAKLLAYFIRSRGIQFVRERNAGRAASSLVRKITKVSEKKIGVVARHGLKLRHLCQEGHGQAAIQDAIQIYPAAGDTPDFELTIERACQGDRVACRSPQAFCRIILPGMPSPNGRDMSEETGIHILFSEMMCRDGRPRAYTYADRKPDSKITYQDPQTDATRLALANPNFSPAYSHRLITGGTLPSSAGAAVVRRRRPRT